MYGMFIQQVRTRLNQLHVKANFKERIELVLIWIVFLFTKPFSWSDQFQDVHTYKTFAKNNLIGAHVLRYLPGSSYSGHPYIRLIGELRIFADPKLDSASCDFFAFVFVFLFRNANAASACHKLATIYTTSSKSELGRI